ncbi:hypothetical protein Tco_0424929 [Tanacetum coccineum]
MKEKWIKRLLSHEPSSEESQHDDGNDKLTRHHGLNDAIMQCKPSPATQVLLKMILFHFSRRYTRNLSTSYSENVGIETGGVNIEQLVKEDTAYLRLNFTRNHKDIKTNTPYPVEDIRIAKMKVIKKEPEVLWMFEIEDDLFTCDAPLGMTFNEFNRLSEMNDDLFTYKVGIPGVSYPPHGEQQCDNLGNYDDLDVGKAHGRDYRAMVGFDVRKKWMTHGINADMEYDPSDVDFAEWIALKFSNHSTIDWYTKNALWMYWIRGDDEEVLTDKELSDLEETYVNKEDEIAEIFSIKTNIFDFETPLCKAFNEFNYLLKIDTDFLTHDIPGFKTYEEYKNARIYEWNKDVPWVPEEPWLENRVPYEIVNHYCLPFHYEWYEGLEDGELKDKALMKKAEIEESRYLCSFDAEGENFEHANHIGTNANYNPYLDISQIFNCHAGKSNEEVIKDEREPMNDYSIGDSDDHLISNNAPDYANEEQE